MLLSAIQAITNTENFGPKTKEEEKEEAMPSLQNVNQP